MSNTVSSKQRRLVLVDIENYCGKGAVSQSDVTNAKAEIEERIHSMPGDLFIVATSHSNNFVNAKIAWGGAEHVLQCGRNGADIALIAAAKRHLPHLGSFSGVLLFSGDGIFTSLVVDCANAGVRATVVSLASQLNRSLAKAASAVQLVAAPNQLSCAV